MDRREVLRMIAMLTGTAVVGGDLFLSGCTTGDKKPASLPLSTETISLLDEIAETIIPKTGSPGAKDAAVGIFMNKMVMDCYEPAEQQIFIEGISRLNDESNKKFSSDFITADAEKRKELLVMVDKEAKEYIQAKKPGDPPHYFTLMKQLTLLGYFTSEPGATKALRYLAIPQRYDGDIPYTKGEKAWATS